MIIQIVFFEKWVILFFLDFIVCFVFFKYVGGLGVNVIGEWNLVLNKKVYYFI